MGERGVSRGGPTRLFYVATMAHMDGIGRFLASPRGARFAGRVVPVAYENLFRRMTPAYWWQRAREAWWDYLAPPSLLRRPCRRRAAREVVGRLVRYLRAPAVPPRGHYIFSDLELLSEDEAQRAALVWQAVAEAHPEVRLLNHPTRSMRRYELLRSLRERGMNTFDVYRLGEARSPVRYPVFLRVENDHGAARSPLLRTSEELAANVALLESQGWNRHSLLVTEFCDTIDAAGIYRKYSAFVVGDHVFPRGLQFSKHWVQKRADLLDDALLGEERAYVEANPHADVLRGVFRLARIEYGRADYGLRDGAMQVWEINTNPHITSVGARRRLRPAIFDAAERRMAAALDDILDGGAA
jgi:hypothetical protein